MKIYALILLTSLIAFAALSAINVQAQGQATVIVTPSLGGSTDPPEQPPLMTAPEYNSPQPQTQAIYS